MGLIRGAWPGTAECLQGSAIVANTYGCGHARARADLTDRPMGEKTGNTCWTRIFAQQAVNGATITSVTTIRRMVHGAEMFVREWVR